MMNELRELYQEVILDHGKNPRNFRDVEDATSHAHGSNPLCGDQLVVYLKLTLGEVIEDVSFVGKAKRLMPIITGEQPALVAYMLGELKVEGEYQLVVDELVNRGDAVAFETFRADVASATSV